MPLNRFLLFISFIIYNDYFLGFVLYFGFCVQRVRWKITKSSVKLNTTMLGTSDAAELIPDVNVYLK